MTENGLSKYNCDFINWCYILTHILSNINYFPSVVKIISRYLVPRILELVFLSSPMSLGTWGWKLAWRAQGGYHPLPPPPPEIKFVFATVTAFAWLLAADLSSLDYLRSEQCFLVNMNAQGSIWTKRSWLSKAPNPCLVPIPFRNVSLHYLCLMSSDIQTDSSLSIRELKVLMKLNLRIAPHEFPVTNMMELLPFRLNSNWVIVALDGLLSKRNKANKK